MSFYSDPKLRRRSLSTPERAGTSTNKVTRNTTARTLGLHCSMTKTPLPRVRSLNAEQIGELLEGLSTPVRIASNSPHGYPLISTLWFIYAEQKFWCITQASTLMRRNLAANPRCAFEIALQGKRHRLLRGQGDARLDLADGARVTNLMIDRYISNPNGAVAERMRAQIPTEYAICITPRWVRAQGRL